MANKTEHDNLKQGVHCCYLLTYLIFQGKWVFWVSTLKSLGFTCWPLIILKTLCESRLQGQTKHICYLHIVNRLLFVFFPFVLIHSIITFHWQRAQRIIKNYMNGGERILRKKYNLPKSCKKEHIQQISEVSRGKRPGLFTCSSLEHIGHSQEKIINWDTKQVLKILRKLKSYQVTFLATML